jgi:hypothetical protein
VRGVGVGVVREVGVGVVREDLDGRKTIFAGREGNTSITINYEYLGLRLKVVGYHDLQ